VECRFVAKNEAIRESIVILCQLLQLTTKLKALAFVVVI
jgi:hypothetical protein